MNSLHTAIGFSNKPFDAKVASQQLMAANKALTPNYSESSFQRKGEYLQTVSTFWSSALGESSVLSTAANRPRGAD
ncbi:unnamed protein product [Phytophthora lilii]|uniref:Unnamed protein product n=1 Tax=Phytophthora lilii TaxID=2077276 RepID=A0A9W6WMH2_9STRA|nr:unnamed protein product [Phytophthora lilii]